MTAGPSPAPATAGCAEALRQAGIATDDSDLARSLYASDASLYRVPPQVVVFPRDGDDVLAVLAVAREFGTGVTMRGAGTSIAGNAIGPGIVVDTTRHLDRLVRIDPEARTASVQPGLVHAVLQRAAAPHGLRFGPDPSTHTRCTVGGMIGNNACGSRALGYGRTSDNVVALKVALADGEVISPNGGTRHALDFSVAEERRLRGFPEPGEEPPRQLADLDRLVGEHLALIRTEFGRFPRQVSGYALDAMLPERDRRFAELLVGSEGTLAVVLEATVRLVPDPAHRALVLLGFASMADAGDAVPVVLELRGDDVEITACEGLDERITRLVPSAPDLPSGAGWLFVEVVGATAGQVQRAADRVASALGVPARVVTDPAEQAALWRIREDGAGLAARSLTRPAHSGWEDAAVPPDRLGDYLRGFDALLAEHGYDTVPYGHFGDGCVHARIDFELTDDGGRRRFRTFTEEAADLVASFGGSMSGEHGDGRARSELLGRMYSAEAVALMGAVKHVLDPYGILNPGVLVDPAPFDADLRLAAPPAGPLATLYDDAHRCTGVGKCVAASGTGAPGTVMCPSYAASGLEKDSTRGRARVLQDVVTGRLAVTDPAVEEALDLCLSCKGCATDCPTGVDMATYKSEVLAARYSGKRRPRSHYALGRLPQWAAITPPRVANLLLRARPLAGLAKRTAGIDPRRSLPTFSPKRLRSLAQPSRVRPAATPDVWIWADSFTDHFAAQTGHAALALLAEAGIEAKVIPERACCALTWVTTGQLDRARAIVGDTVRTLYPYVASGVPVLGLEPSCLASLRSDAPELVRDDPEQARRAREIAAGTYTLAELLTRLAAEGRWTVPDLTGTEVVVQPHCHQASVLGFDADLALLGASGAAVTRLGGCCGLAGNFGVERGHYETSVAVAEQQLLPAVRAAGERAVVLADGMSCRVQLADLAGVRAVHLAELLAGRSEQVE